MPTLEEMRAMFSKKPDVAMEAATEIAEGKISPKPLGIPPRPPRHEGDSCPQCGKPTIHNYEAHGGWLCNRCECSGMYATETWDDVEAKVGPCPRCGKKVEQLFPDSNLWKCTNCTATGSYKMGPRNPGDQCYHCDGPVQHKYFEGNPDGFRCTSCLREGRYNTPVFQIKRSAAPKTFVITGRLGVSRKEAAERIRLRGHRFVVDVHRSTDYLVKGKTNTAVTRKLEKAEHLGVRIIGEDEFWRRIGWHGA